MHEALVLIPEKICQLYVPNKDDMVELHKNYQVYNLQV